LVVIAVAMLTIAGHVCVVPHAHSADLHAHPWDAAVAGPEPSEHSDQPPGDEAAHNASCTALQSSPGDGLAPVLVALATRVVDLTAPLELVPLELSPARVSNPPPLFLLHASLLI
jgi:hypothetical protein